jgi:FkbM family methyltransferase
MTKTMKNLFKKYCNYLNKVHKDCNKENPLLSLRKNFEEGILDFYDFLDSMFQWNKIPHIIADFLKNTGVEKIEISENCVTYTTKRLGIKMVFDGKDRRGIPFELLSWGTYEHDELLIFDKILSDDLVIFDIGANIGWYSLNWGKQFPNSVIYAFEPIPRTHKFCAANITINGLENINLYEIALSDKTKTADYYYSPESSVLASAQNILEYENAKKTRVKVLTLDEFVEKNKINKLDIIKCDVEGAEFQSIKGSINTIERDHPIIILELFHEWSKWFNYHPDEVLTYLFDLGYLAFLPSNGRLESVNSYKSEDFSRQNYFFFHKRLHSDIIQELIVK